jgi:polysaccharide export outer membrane protein
MLVALLTLCFWSGTAVARTDAVSPGTVLRITVYEHDDLASVVQVAEDGTVVLPLIGKVQVNGMTIPQVTAKVTAELADGYINKPQVNVFVQNFRNRKVTVLGQVNKPGLQEFSGQATLLEIISAAGGLAADAGDTASIKRMENGEEKVIEIDLKSLVTGGNLSQNIPIQENDSIYVSKSGMCFITGQVDKPGTYPCNSDTTVLKMVALAGGFTGKANKSGIRIVRIVENKETKIKEKQTFKQVDLDTKLVADDVLVVPESFF